LPYYFDFDSPSHVLRVRFEGIVTDAEVREYYAAAAKHVDRLEAKTIIVDFHGTTSAADVSPETMRQLAKLRPTIPNPDVPRVIVPPSPSVFGLARMFESYGESTRPNLHVVATQREAYAIVGLESADFKPIDNDPDAKPGS
jgi:hypothetical protein